MLHLPKLDRIDINILAELQKDCRITNAQLSELVGLSPNPCLQRIKRLEQAGYIFGYSANINFEKVIPSQFVFATVRLSSHRRSDFAQFEKSVLVFEELEECHLVAGGVDYILKFLVTDIPRYRAMMEHVLESNAWLSEYFSYVVVKSPIPRRQPSLQLQFSQSFPDDGPE